MTTHAEALLNPISRKEVFTLFDLRSHVFAWVSAAGPPTDLWSVSILDAEVIGVNLDDSAMVEAVSKAALGVDEFFWDWGAEVLYIRTGPGLNPFGGFHVATLRFRFNRDGEELSGDPFEARVSNVPEITTRTGETFDGKVGITAAGSLGLHNADALINRADIEPDGEVTVISRLQTVAGV